ASAATADRAQAARMASGTRTALAGSAVPRPASTIARGPVPADRVLQVAVHVASRDQSAQEALYRQLYDPASPLYREFLSPAEYADRFGVPATQAAAIRSFLEGGG